MNKKLYNSREEPEEFKLRLKESSQRVNHKASLADGADLLEDQWELDLEPSMYEIRYGWLMSILSKLGIKNASEALLGWWW